MQAGMGITDGIIQGKISCFRNKFHKHKEKCSEKRKFLGALCLRSEDDMISHIAPYRPLYGFRNLLTKRHPFCIYAAYNDLLCCLTIFKTVYYRSASLRQLPDPAKYLRLPERLPLKNLSSEDYGIPPVLFRSDLLHDPPHVSRQQTIFHYTQ